MVFSHLHVEAQVRVIFGEGGGNCYYSVRLDKGEMEAIAFLLGSRVVMRVRFAKGAGK